MSTQEGPIYGPASRDLGERRLNEWVEQNGKVDAMKLALNLSIVSVAARRQYTNEELACLQQDARDLRVAAQDFARWADQLARDWRAQREDVDDRQHGRKP